MAKKHRYHDVDRKLTGGWGAYYEVNCVVCGKNFEAKRSDASFCSATCRSRELRQRKEVEKRIKLAKQAVNDLIEVLPHYGSENAVWVNLQVIQGRIRSALEHVESEGGQLILPVWTGVGRNNTED